MHDHVRWDYDGAAQPFSRECRNLCLAVCMCFSWPSALSVQRVATSAPCHPRGRLMRRLAISIADGTTPEGAMTPCVAASYHHHHLHPQHHRPRRLHHLSTVAASTVVTTSLSTTLAAATLAISIADGTAPEGSREAVRRCELPPLPQPPPPPAPSPPSPSPLSSPLPLTDRH